MDGENRALAAEGQESGNFSSEAGLITIDKVNGALWDGKDAALPERATAV